MPCKYADVLGICLKEVPWYTDADGVCGVEENDPETIKCTEFKFESIEEMTIRFSVASKWKGVNRNHGGFETTWGPSVNSKVKTNRVIK